ncbi:unnamed protein product [Musa acuminata subsp. malaccensis]|uniref:(wild Malaysian banana) hypothetical protein n=1 Tax=Musa acuminata subsp. malaccensis TaxID=214687 RepID=A0A804IE60_MUSAM|nr:PREDICTED: uncharacterized protein LOC103974637 [Musa acuminata subsp. malaccensis]CAG1850739.1 unnamed protein product [Musa acuminata subsp. malaccensis]
MEPTEKGQTSMSSKQSSQQFSSGNQSAQIDLLPMYTPMAVNWGSQEWFSAERNLVQTGMQVPVPLNVGSYQLFSIRNQPMQIESSYRSQIPMPIFVGLDQLSSSNRPVLGPQSSLNIRPSMSSNLASQPLSSTNKRPIQIRAPTKLQSVMPMKMVSQSSSMNKRPAQMELPRKVQSESFESVRSKLRESLAASLATVSDQQSKQQIGEKSTDGKTSSTEAKMVIPSGDLNSETKDASSDKFARETLVADGSAPKYDEVQSLASDKSSKEKTTVNTVLTRSDVEALQSKDVLVQDEVPNDKSFVKDELLQGHGLCWVSELDAETVDDSVTSDQKRLKMTNEHETGGKGTTVQNAEDLAFRIEAELFRLFGGVNKKYKEKGRSLLFNLKDRSNPELRERVLSGEIAPERLCAMTAEELASEELSQWRLAKAEELAQMVVLPDSDVDLRRLVKKTHKGEFQVEVEQAERFPVEVELRASVISRVPSKTKEDVKKQSKSDLKDDEPKSSERSSSVTKIDSGDQNLPSDLDKNDLMQELMVGELKDPELLPPIVSLDEFMQALDSEPPFENLPVDSSQEVPSSGLEKLDCLETEKLPVSDSMEHKQDSASGSVEPKPDSPEDGSVSKLESPQEGIQTKLHSSDDNSEDPAAVSPDEMDVDHSRDNDDLKSGSANIQSDTCPTEVAATGNKIWEGLIQLNVSSVATVNVFYKSGEKSSTQEWPSLLEIKGRVRLDAFEKFLKELPLSRSRAVMIAQFCWKEGSPESGRLNLLEVIDSYIADERVGFAVAAPGVELYLCPSRLRTIEMLEKFLPKEHSETLPTTADGLFAVVVWRRPHEMLSPRVSSHHKHGSSKKHSSSRRQHNSNSYSASRSSAASLPAADARLPPEDDTEDVPPGFGPRDEDDLPEFDFARGSSQGSQPVASRRLGSGATRSRVLPPPARPVEHIREMIHKYGQSERVKKRSFNIQPWNVDDDDDDDDIPEWQPQQDCQPQTQSLPPPPPALPPPPPPPPQHPQLHAYQQQTLQSYHVNHQMLPLQPQQLPPQSYTPSQQLVPMAALPPAVVQQPPLPPQIAVMHQPRWQQAPLLSPATNLMQATQYNSQPNVEGQLYSLPNLGTLQQQNLMGWRTGVFGNRGP